MAESPVSLHSGGGTLAQAVLASAPAGMLDAPVWKRIAAFILDVIAISLLIEVLSRFQFLSILASWGYLAESSQYQFSFIVSWAIFFAGFYLYWKYTGKTYGRSLGQRAFRIAIVHDNGTILEEHHWGKRAVSKLV